MCCYIFYCVIYIKKIKKGNHWLFYLIKYFPNRQRKRWTIYLETYLENMQIAGIVQDDAEIDELIKSESDIDPNIWSNIH